MCWLNFILYMRSIDSALMGSPQAKVKSGVGEIFDSFLDILTESILEEQVFWDYAHFVHERYASVYTSIAGMGPLIPAVDYYEGEIGHLKHLIRTGEENGLAGQPYLRRLKTRIAGYDQRLRGVTEQEASSGNEGRKLFYNVKLCFQTSTFDDGWDGYETATCSDCNGTGHGKIMATHWLDSKTVESNSSNQDS